MFRDDLGAYLGSRQDRRKAMREVLKLEEEHLYGGSSISFDSASAEGGGSSHRLQPAGSATLKALTSHQMSLSASRARSPEKIRAASVSQQRYMERLARPVSPPQKTFTDFIRAPRSIQGAGLARSQDVLFEPDADGNFWLYGSQKVTQSTIGNVGPNGGVPSDDEIRKLPVCAAVRKRIDSLMAIAATRSRCGIIFDIVSTSRVIASGIPHQVGSYIYDYIDQAHYNVVSLKFVFVGITDNVNCCAARDVFCRDDRLNGKYIGDTKRPFDALDNVHMFTVQPAHRLHPFSGGASGEMQNCSSVVEAGGSTMNNTSFSVVTSSPQSARGTAKERKAGEGGGDTGKTFVTQQQV
jgi:hypothetical protein